MGEKYWGVDLGGTKIEGVVLASTEAPDPLCRIRIETEPGGGYAHVVERIRLLVDQMRAETGLEPGAIGIGTPGVLDPQTQTLKNCNATCLNGQPLRRDLLQALGCEVVLANDANCFALSEARLGAARGASTVFGIIMGTGIGGGIVIEGRALYGCQGIAGEWGHNRLDASGPECYCGRRGCVETFISGPALQDYYASISGRQRGLLEIAPRAAQGTDPYAEATVARLITFSAGPWPEW